METKKIKLLSWFKNNQEWYTPENQEFLDLECWEHFEIINWYNRDNFLVYCWNGEKENQESRLYKATFKN